VNALYAAIQEIGAKLPSLGGDVIKLFQYDKNLNFLTFCNIRRKAIFQVDLASGAKRVTFQTESLLNCMID
jgi:hypothetical protein